MKLHNKFDLAERVKIDGGDVIATVVSIEIRPSDSPPSHVIRYEVSWWHSGDVKFATFDEFRLSRTGLLPAAAFSYDDRGS